MGAASVSMSSPTASQMGVTSQNDAASTTMITRSLCRTVEGIDCCCPRPSTVTLSPAPIAAVAAPASGWRRSAGNPVEISVSRHVLGRPPPSFASGNTVRWATRRAIATAASGASWSRASNMSGGTRANNASRTTTAVRDRPPPVRRAPSPKTATGSTSHGVCKTGDRVNRSLTLPSKSTYIPSAGSPSENNLRPAGTRSQVAERTRRSSSRPSGHPRAATPWIRAAASTGAGHSSMVTGSSFAPWPGCTA